MSAEPKFNRTNRPATKRPIHITSHDKRLLEDLLAECAALRCEPTIYLTALAQELQRAIVVDPENVPADVITMNSRAQMLDLETSEIVTFTLVFPSRAD